MLIPQFTLRWLLGMTAVLAVVSLVMSWAMRGSPWAVGVSAALVGLVLVGLVYAAMFAAVWLFSLLDVIRPRRARDASQKGKP